MKGCRVSSAAAGRCVVVFRPPPRRRRPRSAADRPPAAAATLNHLPFVVSSVRRRRARPPSYSSVTPRMRARRNRPDGPHNLVRCGPPTYDEVPRPLPPGREHRANGPTRSRTSPIQRKPSLRVHVYLPLGPTPLLVRPPVPPHGVHHIHQRPRHLDVAPAAVLPPPVGRPVEQRPPRAPAAHRPVRRLDERPLQRPIAPPAQVPPQRRPAAPAAPSAACGKPHA